VVPISYLISFESLLIFSAASNEVLSPCVQDSPQTLCHPRLLSEDNSQWYNTLLNFTL